MVPKNIAFPTSEDFFHQKFATMPSGDSYWFSLVREIEAKSAAALRYFSFSDVQKF